MNPPYAEAVQQFHESIRDEILAHPEKSYEVLGQQFQVSYRTIFNVAKKFGIRRRLKAEPEQAQE